MAREIKFRGKRIDNGEWVYGGYFKDGDAHLIVTGEGTKLRAIPVKMVTQYIGLNDKNNKEIYESDIVKVTWANKMKSINYIVKYAEDCAYYMLKCVIDEFEDEFELDTFCGYDISQLEVLGNIYENPKLLNV